MLKSKCYYIVLCFIIFVVAVIKFDFSFSQLPFRSWKSNYHVLIKQIYNTSTNSSNIFYAFKDPEIDMCYSFKSIAMPEDIMNLDEGAFANKTFNNSIQRKVTFEAVHSILYGDPSTKLIYRYAKKYFNKSFDPSFPYTQLTAADFTTIIGKLHPSLSVQFVVEIGSFTGNSATKMGKVLKKSYPKSFLLCIDTWVGSLIIWIDKVAWKNFGVTEDGRPTVYYQFLANVIHENLTDIILPVSMPSITGARFLRKFGFRPQLIYLDSSHEQGETLIEIALYWHILLPGGVLFGDDFGWLSVRCDVKKFMYLRNVSVEHVGATWFMRKPLI